MSVWVNATFYDFFLLFNIYFLLLSTIFLKVKATPGDICFDEDFDNGLVAHFCARVAKKYKKALMKNKQAVRISRIARGRYPFLRRLASKSMLLDGIDFYARSFRGIKPRFL